MLVCAYGASTAITLYQLYEQTLDNALSTIQSIAKSAEVGTNHAFFEADAMLLGAQEMLNKVFPDAPLQGATVKLLLRQLNEQSRNVRDIFIVGNDGIELNSAASTTIRRRDFAEQAVFQVHRDAILSSLYIGPPHRNPATGMWSIMISRPLLRDNDKMVGVIAAEMPITVFTEFYAAIVTTPETSITLLDDRGAVIVSEPYRPELIGQTPEYAPMLTDESAKARNGRIDVATGEAALRLALFRKIPARPLIVVVSRDRQNILREWRSEANGSWVAFALFALTAGSLTWLVVRSLIRQQVAAAKVRDGERRLGRERALLQSTLENIGEGLSVFDRSGHLVAWNERFIEMLELPGDIGSGATLREVLSVQSLRGDFDSEPEQIDVDERVERFYRDVPIVRERLTPLCRTLLIRRRSMPDGGVVSVYSDITERKAAETKAAQAFAEVQLAHRVKSDFLANMSHELRTPLNAIIGFSEIISSERLGKIPNPIYLEYSNDIHSSGLLLLSIINDVLDMSKLEAGKLDLLEQDFAVQPLLASVVRMVAERMRAQNLEMVCRVSEQELIVIADERALKQCLLNLLSNAIKFSSEGGEIIAEILVDPRNRTVISITDHGIGMSDEDKERALQPFGQANSTISRSFGGTGLGLSITNGLVAAHGGVLEIESRVGEGTCVRIILPPERTWQESACLSISS